jgi:glycosyltransferase involved in cell wall biosynthesis
LAACLAALSVAFPADAETIVVSDGGSLDLGPVVAPFVGCLRLRLIRIEHGGPSAARNHGIRVARGEIIAFTDDDCRPAPGWVDLLAASVRLSPPHAVGGSTFCGLEANKYADTAQLVLLLLSVHDRAVAHQERFLASNNFAFPAAALRQLGGFDERFQTAEDRELCRRWVAAGFSLGRVSDAVVQHDQRMNLRSFTAKFFAYGRGAAKFPSSAKDAGADSSNASSMGASSLFHFRLPALAYPELRQRGLVRGSAVTALLVLWEAANLAGYVFERCATAGLQRNISAAAESRAKQTMKPRRNPDPAAGDARMREGALKSSVYVPRLASPRVSVIIPTRNRREKLERALASVAAQNFRDFEIVVVDDGSTDGTAEWVRTAFLEEDLPEVHLIEIEKSVGAAAARNRGIERSCGEIVAFLDDDDRWHPSYLEKQVAQFAANPQATLCTTGHVEVDPTRMIAHPDLEPLYRYPDRLVHMLAECPIHTLSVVACRRAALETIGSFDESLSIVHDLDWYLRLMVAGGVFESCPTALVDHSVPGGLVTRHRRWYREERTVQKRFAAACALKARARRRIRASRALFFARLSLAKGDFTFGFTRLAEALLVSPLDAVGTAVGRLLRRRQRRRFHILANPETDSQHAETQGVI